MDQTPYLAQHTNTQGTFGKFMNFQEGADGMATLSGVPINSTKILPLADAQYEPRISIVQEIELSKDGTILIANVHFEWVNSEEGMANRMKQAQALVNHINTLNKAAIVVGDFNCTPDAPTMNYFKEQGFFL